MADQDYPNLYALMEASVARVRDAALAYEKTLGGNTAETVPVNGYPDQPTIAGRVDAAIAALAETMESAAMQELKSLLVEIPVDPGVTSAHEFSDGFGFIIAKLLINGTLDLPGFQLASDGDGFELSDAYGFVVSKLGIRNSIINGLTVQVDPADGIYICDDYNFILAKADKDGVYFGQAQTPAAVALPPVVAQLGQQKRTDYMQVLGYGQSLSRGVNAIPAISLSQPYSNVMLAGGVRKRATDPGYNALSFVPLVEFESSGEGETPVSAICNGVTRRAVEAGELASKWVMVGQAPGRSGASVEALSPPPLGASNGDFVNMVKSVDDTFKLATSLGKTYSVWGYAWEQGETNYILGGAYENSPYQYMQYQLNLFDTLTEQVVGITGQKFRPYLFSYQVAAHRRYSRDDMPIALSQWRISRERPDVVLAVPCYIFPVASDNLHLTNEGSWLMGEYKSRAMFETMIRRNGKWRPLEPISVDWGDTQVDIKFHVPRGKLVLDNALAATTANSGFDIRESGGVASIITSITLVGTDTVRLALSRAAADDAVLSYARGRPGDAAHSGPVTGARGNLRDTHGLYDSAVSPLGNTFQLHNPCVMFQYDRKTGF